MGRYLNPGNDAFRMIAEQDYVDKTGLISIVNQSIGTMDSLICISRPRRFGKSYAAAMLSAYYDCGCDSHDLFREKEISKAPDFEKHLNQYHVIQLDITGFPERTPERGIYAQCRRKLMMRFGKMYSWLIRIWMRIYL